MNQIFRQHCVFKNLFLQAEPRVAAAVPAGTMREGFFDNKSASSNQNGSFFHLGGILP